MDWLLWADVAGTDLFGDVFWRVWLFFGAAMVVTLLIVSGCAYSIAARRKHGRGVFSVRALLATTALLAICLAVLRSGNSWALLALVACLAVLPWMLFARR